MWNDTDSAQQLQMAEYELMVDYEKCTGCRICETACSIRHGFESNPEKSMIRVVNLEGEADVVSIPIKCMFCEDAPCETICPVGAISTNQITGARQVDKERCIGCSACVYACPFGAVIIDRTHATAVICDLCDGDPLCARLCPFQAIQYIRSDEISIKLKRNRANKLLDYLKLS